MSFESDRDQIKRRIRTLEAFIESRSLWKDLCEHPTWSVFVKSLDRLKYKALLDLGSAKTEEMQEYKALYDAICLVKMVIAENTRFDDLETALDQKKMTIEEIETLDREEEFDRRTVQIGGVV